MKAYCTDKKAADRLTVEGLPTQCMDEIRILCTQLGETSLLLQFGNHTRKVDGFQMKNPLPPGLYQMVRGVVLEDGPAMAIVPPSTFCRLV